MRGGLLGVGLFRMVDRAVALRMAISNLDLASYPAAVCPYGGGATQFAVQLPTAIRGKTARRFVRIRQFWSIAGGIARLCRIC